MDNDSESLLNVTSSHLNSGMRGIPVGTCRTSFVTPTEGVHYAGYPIAELMNFSPEQIFYLLLHKSLPTPEQTTSFMNELKSRGEVPREIIDVLLALPKHGHPMDWMSTGIMALGMFDQDENWTENGLNLVAKMPRMMGLIFRIREGRVQNIPDDDLSKNLVDRFIHTLEPGADTSVMAKIVSAFLVLHMDHGGGNLSTFTGKAIASGLATLYTSISGSMMPFQGLFMEEQINPVWNLSRKLGPVIVVRLNHSSEMSSPTKDPSLDSATLCSEQRTPVPLYKFKSVKRYAQTTLFSIPSSVY